MKQMAFSRGIYEDPEEVSFRIGDSDFSTWTMTSGATLIPRITSQPAISGGYRSKARDIPGR